MSRLFASLAVAMALMAQPVVADTPRPFPVFEAKRVGVPKTGDKRITVQIDPDAQRAALAVPEPLPPEPAADAPPSTAPVGQYGWFWDKVSPSIFDVQPGRLSSIMDVITGSGEVPAPRLQHMQGIAQANGRHILKSTVGTRVSPALVLAVISVESAGKTEAVSSAGAQGLMQLMPDTAARFGVADSFEASQNIAGGVKYLDWLMEEFGGDPVLVLAGYNAGEGSVRSYDGVPPFAETRDYVPKVLAAFQVARGLCLTPPELISDGCVFAAMNRSASAKP
ncbi:lytic transglycosylase domain-containing protein [Roseobacter sinensis]|uniref:Lytic transglycosylase domain-containing protein n=1 Tax=Roseobacter sinensis TaxID=2931391 RepID=A0ABT3BH01_9RHOB|nr:lytic transglycosylase domain-containing protein [Roseobacter sp. WL0113]MCV3272865.1 lytic transglycosylase domain-containing protein [Roseobacter sp. WL0113]